MQEKNEIINCGKIFIFYMSISDVKSIFHFYIYMQIIISFFPYVFALSSIQILNYSLHV